MRAPRARALVGTPTADAPRRAPDPGAPEAVDPAAVDGFGGAVLLDLRTTLVLARRPG